MTAAIDTATESRGDIGVDIGVGPRDEPRGEPRVGPVSHALLDEADAAMRRGQVCQARDLLLRTDREQGACLDPDDRARLLALLLECRLAQGDVGEAVALGDELALLGDHPHAHRARAELAAALGEHELAVDLFAVAHAAATEHDQGPWHPGAALAMARSGRRVEAHALASRHHATALEHGSPSEVAVTLRVLATTVTDPRRVTLLRRALDLLDGVEAARLRAQVETDLAGLLLLEGQHAEALGLLRDAERYAGREELAPLQGRVRRLLARMGEAPRRTASEALAGLTEGERRVVSLVLGGRTNRQIAEQLAVSVKAVEGHLSKVYRKVGVASRAALVAAVTASMTSAGSSLTRA